jgi:hypothetical protein
MKKANLHFCERTCMRTLFVAALALNLAACTSLPNLDSSAYSKPVVSKVSAQNATKSTKPQTRSSAQFGKKTKAGARATYTVAGKNAPLPPAQLNGTAEPVIEKAKTSIAAMMANPAAAKFSKIKRAVKKLLDEPVDTICGYVKGKNASGGDTGEMAFLYIIRDDRDGEAYLVDGTSYTAQIVHSVLCD